MRRNRPMEREKPLNFEKWLFFNCSFLMGAKNHQFIARQTLWKWNKIIENFKLFLYLQFQQKPGRAHGCRNIDDRSRAKKPFGKLHVRGGKFGVCHHRGPHTQWWVKIYIKEIADSLNEWVSELNPRRAFVIAPLTAKALKIPWVAFLFIYLVNVTITKWDVQKRVVGNWIKQSGAVCSKRWDKKRWSYETGPS